MLSALPTSWKCQVCTFPEFSTRKQLINHSKTNHPEVDILNIPRKLAVTQTFTTRIQIRKRFHRIHSKHVEHRINSLNALGCRLYDSKEDLENCSEGRRKELKKQARIWKNFFEESKGARKWCDEKIKAIGEKRVNYKVNLKDANYTKLVMRFYNNFAEVPMKENVQGRRESEEAWDETVENVDESEIIELKGPEEIIIDGEDQEIVQINEKRFEEEDADAACSMFEHDGHLHCHVDMPGIATEDFKIDVTKNSVLLTAQRSNIVPKGATVIADSRKYGPMEYRLCLPPSVQAETCQALFNNGVLMLSFQKRAS